MTPSILTLSIMILNIMTLNVMTLRIMTLSILTLITMTLSTECTYFIAILISVMCNAESCYVNQHYADCRGAIFITLKQGTLTEGEGSVQFTSLY